MSRWQNGMEDVITLVADVHANQAQVKPRALVRHVYARPRTPMCPHCGSSEPQLSCAQVASLKQTMDTLVDVSRKV